MAPPNSRALNLFSTLEEGRHPRLRGEEAGPEVGSDPHPPQPTGHAPRSGFSECGPQSRGISLAWKLETGSAPGEPLDLWASVSAVQQHPQVTSFQVQV